MQGLFVGFNPRSSDIDFVRSPTSPLDFRIFSSFRNPFKHSRTQNEGQNKRWNCEKVGLSIIDYLKDEAYEPRGSSNKTSILLERNLSVRSLDFRTHANSHEPLKSLTKYATFFPVKQQAGAKMISSEMDSSGILVEILKSPFGPGKENKDSMARSVDSEKCGSYLTDFGSHELGFGSANSVPGNTEYLVPSMSHDSIKLQNFIPFQVSEIEHSEDYTCVRTHGLNPKLTHIFCDHVFECQNDEVTPFVEKFGDDYKIPVAFLPSDFHTSYPSNSFLKFCYLCKKLLDGEDIYMYRGEKAFCSFACRTQEIEFEEKMEMTNNNSFETADTSPNGLEITSKGGLFIAT